MSISTRLFAWIMLVFTAFVAIVIIVDTTLMNYFFAFITVLKMYDIDDMVNQMYLGPETEYLETLNELELKFNISVEIFDKNDRLIYSTDSPNAVYGEETDQSLIKAYGREADSDAKFSTPSGRERIWALKTYQRTQDAEKVVFFVDTMELENGYRLKTYTSLAAIQDGATVSLIIVVLTSVILIFFALIIVKKITRRMTRPLNDIIEITHDISTRDFSKRCPPSNTIEIDTLSQSVNALSESLSGAIEELKKKNVQLQADYEKEKELE
ncbi:MAG: HAMP domain-containing protein, partial [Clostridia bacterium]|nr:HAMP domain-containing protein [Clostridia bacterium]